MQLQADLRIMSAKTCEKLNKSYIEIETEIGNLSMSSINCLNVNGLY